MKRTIAALCLLAFGAAGLYAASSSPLVLYAAGKAEVQDAKGKRRPAAIGDYVFVNETIITGKGGRITLQSKDGVFDVFESTVLKLMETQKNGRKQNAYVCALGRVSMKVNKLAAGDPGPRLGSSTAAAGVKGTALDVYEGAEGSSLILVTEGAVDVESTGKTVALNPSEGVEVTPGLAPGRKFSFKLPEDYRDWTQSKADQFDKDPVAAIAQVGNLANEYVDKIEALWKEYLAKWAVYEGEWAKWNKLQSEQGEKAGLEYFNTNVLPLGNAAAGTFMEIRYNSLSLLSLRRFIIGRMYLVMRTKYFGNESASVYKDFMKAFDRTTGAFNKEFTIKRNFGTLLPRESPFLEEGNI